MFLMPAASPWKSVDGPGGPWGSAGGLLQVGGGPSWRSLEATATLAELTACAVHSQCVKDSGIRAFQKRWI